MTYFLFTAVLDILASASPAIDVSMKTKDVVSGFSRNVFPVHNCVRHAYYNFQRQYIKCLPRPNICPRNFRVTYFLFTTVFDMLITLFSVSIRCLPIILRIRVTTVLPLHGCPGYADFSVSLRCLPRPRSWFLSSCDVFPV